MNGTAVLVVDDEPQIRKLLRTGLASYGYHLNVVATGGEALEALAHDKPAIVVLDINLGAGIDGLDVCRQLRG